VRSHVRPWHVCACLSAVCFLEVGRQLALVGFRSSLLDEFVARSSRSLFVRQFRGRWRCDLAAARWFFVNGSPAGTHRANATVHRQGHAVLGSLRLWSAQELGIACFGFRGAVLRPSPSQLLRHVWPRSETRLSCTAEQPLVGRSVLGARDRSLHPGVLAVARVRLGSPCTAVLYSCAL
jgi:hypothetical protein